MKRKDSIGVIPGIKQLIHESLFLTSWKHWSKSTKIDRKTIMPRTQDHQACNKLPIKFYQPNFLAQNKWTKYILWFTIRNGMCLRKMHLVSSLVDPLLSFFWQDKVDDLPMSFLARLALQWVQSLTLPFSSSWASGMSAKFSVVDILIFFLLNIKIMESN